MTNKNIPNPEVLRKIAIPVYEKTFDSELKKGVDIISEAISQKAKDGHFCLRYDESNPDFEVIERFKFVKFEDIAILFAQAGYLVNFGAYSKLISWREKND